MNGKTASFIAGMAALTAFCLAGSIFLIFYLTDKILTEMSGYLFHIPIIGMVFLFALISFASAFGSGGIWGLGIAGMMNADAKPLARSGALTWGSTVMVAGLILYFAQIPIAQFDKAYPVSDHYLFTLAFLPAVGLAAGLNILVMAGKLGLGELKKAMGRNAGIAASLGFLTVSLVLLFVFDWEVGGPYAGTRYSMITIMHVCNVGAALAGGAVMGWMLARERKGMEDLTAVYEPPPVV